MPASLQMTSVIIDPNSFTKPLIKRRKSSIYSIQIGNNAFANCNAQLRKDLLSSRKSDRFPMIIAQNLYGSKSLPDTLINHIIECKLRPSKRYLYSCLNFVLLKETVESATGIAMDKYLQQNIYGPLGMQTTGYRPLDRFPTERIAPTECDNFYRKQQLIGYVHDETACFSEAYKAMPDSFPTPTIWLNYAKCG